jgi:hypothetical protein
LESMTGRARAFQFVCKQCCLHVNNKKQKTNSPRPYM